MGHWISTREMIEARQKVMINMMLERFSTSKTILQYWKKTLCMRLIENWSMKVMMPKNNRKRLESRNCSTPTGFARRQTTGVRCSGLSDSLKKQTKIMFMRLSAEAAIIGARKLLLERTPPKGMPTRTELMTQAKSSAKCFELVSAVLTSPT
mmetsp:Transcript_40480/g.84722  ORF Transcript_40480/g.84722 Transcript_40480/m.84722 type:complete len:152 (-) Transcript_40480:564-1019(-)